MVDWEVDVIDGIDGIEQEQINHQSRWVSASAKEHWTKGAIGSALSHIKAWRRCIELNQDVLVAEDDAVLANDLKRKLEELNIIGAITANQTNISAPRLEPGLTASRRTFTRAGDDQPIRADLSKTGTNRSNHQQQQRTKSLQLKSVLWLTRLLDQSTNRP